MFDVVYGHGRVKKQLGHMVKTGKVSRSLAFVGPDGVGKRMLAMELARAVLCETQTGCGTCLACQKCQKGLHPDVQVIAPETTQIKVDQVRQIAENLHYKPFEGRARFIVIDRAETLRDEAANAFLKSLEEPPEYVHFVLVTSDWNALLATIRSRCQRLAFQPLRHGDKVKILMERGLEEVAAHQLAGISWRRLQTDLEAWQTFEKHVQLALDYLKLCLAEGGVPGAMTATARDKASLDDFLDVFVNLLRACCHVRLGRELEPPFDAFLEPITQLAEQATQGQWREAWQEAMAFQVRRVFNPNTALWFDTFATHQLGNFDKAAQDFRARIQSRG
ncbi:MAG: DNA polymerase III subunit delta' [Acidobacteria bacterium]|nr:DNA polymerase III subunit delta' [Acidobacteriota bacterium]